MLYDIHIIMLHNIMANEGLWRMYGTAWDTMSFFKNVKVLKNATYDLQDKETYIIH